MLTIGLVIDMMLIISQIELLDVRICTGYKEDFDEFFDRVWSKV